MKKSMLRSQCSRNKMWYGCEQKQASPVIITHVAAYNKIIRKMPKISQLRAVQGVFLLEMK